MIDILSKIWPYIFSILLPAGTLLVLFKFKKQQSRVAFVISLIFFILFFLSLLIIGLSLGVDFPQIVFIIFGIPAVIFNFIAAFYKNDLENKFYQKFRTITLALFNCLLIVISIYAIVNDINQKQKSGLIGGISKTQAIEIAKKEINPGVNTDECNTEEPYLYYGKGKPALYTVGCDIYWDDTDKVFMTKDIDVNAKDGNIVYIDNEYKVRFKITKNGQPVSNTHFFTGHRGGGYSDYGITDDNGLVSFVINQNFTTRIYNLNYEYIDLPQDINQEYELNWDNATQHTGGSLLF